MTYQVGARENVDVAAQEAANIPSPLMGVCVLVEGYARNVTLSQEVAYELRGRVLVAKNHNGTSPLDVIRDGVK